MKTLKEQLQAKNEEMKKIAPPEAIVLMQKAIDDLSSTPIIDGATKTGDKLPEITLPNINGEHVSINQMLKNNKVVIAWYRGGWCPYCNLELQALEEVYNSFEAKGVKLVAISPDTPEKASETKDKHQLSFEVLIDKDNHIAKELGLVYQIPEDLNNLYLEFGIDLKDSQGNDALEIPIPATYIVEQDNTISYAFLNEDYTKRAEPSDIIEKL